MLRSLLLYLSHAGWARQAITRLPFARRAAGRFIAGETPAEAIRAIRELAGRGLTATANHLGENVHDEAGAARAATADQRLLEQVRAAGLNAHISVKPTHLGLDLGDRVCRDNVQCIAEKARDCGSFVRVDMEGSEYTERTLALVRGLRREAGLENVGAVIQSYLYRSEQDVRDLCAEGIRVRLCKGAYQEPPDRAYPRKEDVDASYVRLARLLLDAARDHAADGGLYPAFATHDPAMIAAVKDHAAEQGLPNAAYEFQMLLGIRRDLQDSLVAAGYNVRIYIPYGTEWYPYFMRRLAERPANVWFLLSNLIRA
jgi:proline dehydrogenase